MYKRQLLLLDKPAGLLCHEDQRERRDTLVNRMLRYLYEKGEYDPAAEQSFTPALCNRKMCIRDRYSFLYSYNASIFRIHYVIRLCKR